MAEGKFNAQALTEALQALTEAVRTEKSVQENLQKNVRQQLLAGISSEDFVLQQMANTASAKNMIECKDTISRIQEDLHNLRHSLESSTDDFDIITSTFTGFVQLTQERSEICKQLTDDQEEANTSPVTQNTTGSTTRCIIS